MSLVMAFTLVAMLLMPVFRRRFFPLTPVRRLVLLTVLITLSLLGVCWPLAHQRFEEKFSVVLHPVAIDAESTITDYDATYRVTADGRLAATEVLTVDLPADRHGIFRFFPVADPTDPHTRLVPTVTAVSMDRHPVPVDYSWHTDRTVYVAQIGNPERTVDPGLHTYTIEYTIDGLLVKPPSGPGKFTARAGTNPSPPTASFYFNVVGFWAMGIDSARVVIELPGPAGLVQCAADETGAIPCVIDGAGTDRVTVTAAALPPQNPVTARVDLAVALPHRATLPWPVRFDGILGRSLPTVGWVIALSMVAGLLGYAGARRSREPAPGIPVLYVPPDGLGPVQTVYIVNETVGEYALVATLLYLAERGLVRLDRANSHRWTITGSGTPEQWAAVDPVSRAVGTALGVVGRGAVFTANGGVKAGEKLSAATAELKSSSSTWARDRGLMVSAIGERLGQVAVIAAMLLAGVAFIGALAPTMWGIPFAAFAVAGVELLTTGVGTRRTGPGRQLWSRAAGLQRLLSTPSSEERFDFAARKDLFIAYIPYAVAFGVADRWAEKYRAATGTEPPVPGWYPTSGGARPASLYSAGGPRALGSAVAASISAYHSSQSSSGSSGSGFSSSGGGWGGGGGGGGGTW